MIESTADIPANCATIVDVLRWRAQHEPGREAFSFLADGEGDEVTLTYAELDRWARGIAAGLQAVAASGDRAVILCPPGLDYQAAFYGVLCAGLVVVPFYPPQQGTNAEPLEHMLRVTRPAAIIAPFSKVDIKGLRARLPVLSQLHWIDTDHFEDDEVEAWHEPEITPDTWACLYVSSGSTAAPKGVIQTHGKLMSHATHIAPYLRGARSSRVVSWVPPHFGFALSYTRNAVQLGFPLTLLPAAAVLERPIRWLRAISQSRAAYSSGSNFAFDLCAELVTEREKQDLDLSCVISIRNSGEQVRAATLDRFARAFADCGFRREAFSASYGLSEAIVSMTAVGEAPKVRTFDRAALQANRAVPVEDGSPRGTQLVGCGSFFAGQRGLIVDPETLGVCEPDEIGEIWVSGDTVAVGYWEQPEETDRTFHAYVPSTGEGPFLRTGDLGFLYDGELFITGRHKELIIIRGKNLSPQDVEHTVQASHPDLVPNAGAAFSVDEAGQERLVVVHEVAPHAQALEEIVGAIRRAVSRHHEVQVYAVVLIPPGTLPKTASGKIQRAGCRSAYQEGRLSILLERVLTSRERPALSAPYEASRTSTEAALVGVWEEVLGMEGIGVHDHFAELGGDSLLSMQVLARAKQGSISLTHEQIARYPTVAELAASVGTARSVIITERGAVSGPAPLTPRQHSFLQVQNPQRLSGQILKQVVEVPRPVSPALLHRAVDLLVVHHDALRMRFRYDGSIWQQQNAGQEDHQVFTHLDLSGHTDEEREAAIKAATAAARAAINLFEGPLIQVVLLSSGGHHPDRILVFIDHLVADFFSTSILMQDLETVYLQLERDEQPSLPPKTTSLKQWTERLASYADSAELRNELGFWISLGEGPRLPADRAWTPKERGFPRDVITSLTSDETQALLYKLPLNYDAQVTDVLLTALVEAFSSWTGSRSLHVIMRSHGREALFKDMDVSRTVGWFTAMFPARLVAGDLSSPKAAVRSIKQQLSEIPHHGIGYGVLQYLCSDPTVQEQLHETMHVGVNFNYIGQSDRLHSGLTLFQIRQEMRERRAKRPVHAFDHLFITAAAGEQLHLRIRHHELVYRPATIEALAQRWQEALQSLIAHADFHSVEPSRADH